MKSIILFDKWSKQIKEECDSKPPSKPKAVESKEKMKIETFDLLDSSNSKRIKKSSNFMINFSGLVPVNVPPKVQLLDFK